MSGSTVNPNSHLAVPNVQNDTVSSLSWSPTSNLLAAGSWNKEVRVWDVAINGQITPKSCLTHDAPVLCTAFSQDGVNVFAGTCDKTAKMWNLQNGQSMKVAQHDAPIKEMAFYERHKMLLTGSWDKTLKFWDCRSQNAVATIQLSERVFCMAVADPLCVVGTADKKIYVIDLNNPTKIFRTIDSPLKMQLRSLACFTDKSGFAVGSIEGRVGIQYVEEKRSKDNFAFKCHRVNDTDVYAVNSIAFHPVHGTFATCGADGGFAFWDKDAKQRLKNFNTSSVPITCSGFNSTGNIFAYALSYDWSKGISFYKKEGPFQIMLYPVQEGDIAPRRR